MIRCDSITADLVATASAYDSVIIADSMSLCLCCYYAINFKSGMREAKRQEHNEAAYMYLYTVTILYVLIVCFTA